MGVKLLDCTLRDGGYVNNWKFGKQNIRSIVSGLVASNVDVVELGFLDKRVEVNLNKTITSDMSSFDAVLAGIDKKNTKFFAMIDYGTFDIDDVIPKDRSIIDGIRVIFTQDKIEDALKFCSEVSNKGYIVFANAVNITNYSDSDFKRLFDSVNGSSVDGVSIVDTYGILSPDDAFCLYDKFDKNIDDRFFIGFHAHNTLQLAMGNCFSIIKKMNPNRVNFIDGTLCGMGKGSGNAYTEILIRFLNSFEHSYDMSPIFDLLQKNMCSIMQMYSWNYSLGRFASSIHNVYYKYTDYFQKIKGLDLSDIVKIEALIDDSDRFDFSQEKADFYYNLYCENKCKYNAVIFDIDGTILDTTSGILSAIDYTISACNLNDLEYDDKLYFIGPPIQDSFKRTYNLTDEDAALIAAVFRDRYRKNDLYKAKLYDGMMSLFKDLRAKGIKIGIATYKREDYTLDLLEHFGISEYCDSIHGSDYEGKYSKYDIIRLVLNELSLSSDDRAVMIGDCETDYQGAEANKIDFIGVTYGFGFDNGEKGKVLAKNVSELRKYLL